MATIAEMVLIIGRWATSQEADAQGYSSVAGCVNTYGEIATGTRLEARAASIRSAVETVRGNLETFITDNSIA